jgi:dCMP deaminase
MTDLSKQRRYDIAYLSMAIIWANLSHAKRKKVGAILVKDGQIISDGFNGTPSGYDNSCEIDDTTRWEVLHAESNAILKCAKYGDSCNGATLYLTYSPCKECSKLIAQAGIARLVYIEEYRDTAGLDFLRSLNVIIEKITMDEIDEINGSVLCKGL